MSDRINNVLYTDKDVVDLVTLFDGRKRDAFVKKLGYIIHRLKREKFESDTENRDLRLKLSSTADWLGKCLKEVE